MASSDLVTASEMRAPRKARATINRLLADRKLTESGLSWLITATDPFHDSAVTPTGFPDVNSNNTLVQCYTQTMNIVAPSSVTEGNTWDCHVVYCPLLPYAGSGTINSIVPYQYSASGGAITSTSATTGAQLYPGYNAVTGPSGFDLYLSPQTALATTSQACPVRAIGGCFRQVSAGFEVVNTTAELYKGGAVTTWRSPNVESKIAYVYNTTSTSAQPTPCYCGTSPPTNQATAQLYPTAKTWGASDGAYGIATLVSQDNPLTFSQVLIPAYIQTPSNAQLAANTNIPAWLPPGFIAYGGLASNATQMTPVPYAWHGAIFTGLPYQSTLQLTTKYYIERCPSVSEPDFLVLARSPPDYDPMALEIYTRTVCELPVAVPVDENPLGEWFNDVLETVSEWAPKLGNVIGGHGKTLGNVVGNLAGKSLRERSEMPEPSVLAEAPQVVHKKPLPPIPNRIGRPPIASATKKKRQKRRRGKAKKVG